jgi:protein ImuB
MTFCAIFVSDFLVQAVTRADATLRNRPIALLDGRTPNFQVIAVNSSASVLGVTLGMTKAAAAEFAGIELIPRRNDLEISAHAALLDAAWSFSPRIEDTAIDTVLLDLAGLTTLFGSYENIALQIKSRCLALGLDAHVAISTNPETARVLACASSGLTIVPEGNEAQFLKSLPVDLLAPSPELSDVFRQWGVTTCGALAALPVLSLSECVGQEGVRLHSIAGGNGQRQLILTQPANVFEESLELDDAVEELEPLSFLLGRLLDQLCARLSARALATRSIFLQLELQPAFEKAFDVSREFLRKRQASETFQCSLTLPRPTQDAKLLLKLLRLRLQSHPPKAPIQKLRMRAEPDRPVALQTGLFLPVAPDPEKLELTLARIAHVVSENNVGFPELLDSHRPDAIRMQKFTATSSEPKNQPAPVNHDNSAILKIGFRALRPPLSAHVTVQDGRPTGISFKGQTWKVVQASGPWRSSGEWWEENPWQEDAWDLELCAAAGKLPNIVVCTVFDGLQQRWFVRGSYD